MQVSRLVLTRRWVQQDAAKQRVKFRVTQKFWLFFDRLTAATPGVRSDRAHAGSNCMPSVSAGNTAVIRGSGGRSLPLSILCSYRINTADFKVAGADDEAGVTGSLALCKLRLRLNPVGAIRMNRAVLTIAVAMGSGVLSSAATAGDPLDRGDSPIYGQSHAAAAAPARVTHASRIGIDDIAAYPDRLHRDAALDTQHPADRPAVAHTQSFESAPFGPN